MTKFNSSEIRASAQCGMTKKKLQAEGSELSEKIGKLKMVSADGKARPTDVADQEQMFRLIQSIPSPKAEPVKQEKGLHRLGKELISLHL